MAIDKEVPKPGSEEAAKLGCRCPVMDNCRGRGRMGLGKDYVVSGDCRVHNVGLKKSDGTETYQVISTRGGKYHKPKEPTRPSKSWFFSTIPTVCGNHVEPLNVFLDLPDALKYTGGSKQYLCKHCFKAELQAKDD